MSPSPKRIIFLVTKFKGLPKGLANYYKAMKNDGHDIKIASVIGTPVDHIIPKEDIIYPLGKYNEFEKCKSLKKYLPDFIITENPYDYYKPFSNQEPGCENLGLIELNKIGTKLIYLPYGVYSLSSLSQIHNPDLPSVIDTVFADSEISKERFVNNFKFSTDRVVVSGYQPFADIRAGLKARDNNKKETILWLPRWTVSFFYRQYFEPGSTFLNYHYFFFNYAKENPQINLIIRPHYELFFYSPKSGFFSKEDLENIFNKFRTLPNVKISSHGTDSLSQDILESDIVISDFSSSIADCVVADKPIIYLSNGFNYEFSINEAINLLQKYLYFAYAPANAPWHPNLTILTHLETIRKNNYQVDYPEKLKKMLDPVENPAEFISNYLLNYDYKNNYFDINKLSDKYVSLIKEMPKNNNTTDQEWYEQLEKYFELLEKKQQLEQEKQQLEHEKQQLEHEKQQLEHILINIYNQCLSQLYDSPKELIIKRIETILSNNKNNIPDTLEHIVNNPYLLGELKYKLFWLKHFTRNLGQKLVKKYAKIYYTSLYWQLEKFLIAFNRKQIIKLEIKTLDNKLQELEDKAKTLENKLVQIT